MERYKSFDGCFDDMAKTVAFEGCRLGQFCMIIVGDAASGRQGEMEMLIRRDVATDEQLETFNQHLTERRAVGQVTGDERRERGQIAVGQGLTIDMRYHVGKVGVHLLLKVFAEGCGQQALIECIEQIATKHGTAALVAEDVAHRGCVLHDVSSVVQA